MGWLSDAKKERIIKSGGPVNKREFDSWTKEEKERWFENVKKNRNRSKRDEKKGSGRW